jgi:hypothetical protein
VDHTLEHAVHAALVYADLFDFPLRADEVHRFLPEYTATLSEVERALVDWPSRAGYYFLRGRNQVVDRRLAREAIAADLWATARHFGRLFWTIPFVRMVGVTGSLAVNNAARGDDIDFMLVTQPKRLWTARALAVGVVRLARLSRAHICPNYLVTTSALGLRQRNLFTAHELVQLVPLSGRVAYQQLLGANSWVWQYLPNASPSPPALAAERLPWAHGGARSLAERALADGFGSRFERWESTRKIRRFTAEAGTDDELGFSADECKGHFDRHGYWTMSAYAGRLSMSGAPLP